MRRHTVAQGEDLIGIAQQYGTTQDALWSLEENEELWEKRPNPNMLRPGDTVMIPDPETREEVVETGARHQFRVQMATTLVRIRVSSVGGELANTPYSFTVSRPDDSELPESSGETDDFGILEESIPADAVSARIELETEDGTETMIVRFGYVDSPNDGYRGLQAMLHSLGYRCGEEDDVLGDKTLAAVQAFQEDYGMAVLPDDATEIGDDVRAKIEAAYEGLLSGDEWRRAGTEKREEDSLGSPTLPPIARE